MGWMAYRPRARMVSRQLRAALAAVVGLTAFLALMTGVFDLPRQQQQESDRVAHALEVLGAAATLEADLARTVIRGRGLIIAGEPGSRERTEAAAAGVTADIAALRALTADRAGMPETIDRLQALIAARLRVLDKDMALKEAGDEAGLHAAVTSHEGRVIMDQIGAVMDSIKADERRRLEQRQRKAEAATRRTVAALVALGAITACSGFLAVLLLVGYRREHAYLKELRRTESLLRAVLETAPAHIYAKDREGRMIAANAAALDFVGKPWSAIAGRTDLEFRADPAQAEALMANDRRVIAEKATLVLEEHLSAASGTRHVMLSTKTPMRDADGTIVGIVGMSVDITERKQTEQRLRTFNAELEASVAARTAELAASEARQRAYFRHSPIGMVVTRARDDGTFTLEDLNPSAMAAFGLPPDCGADPIRTQLWPAFATRDKQQKMQICASCRQVIAYAMKRRSGAETRLLDIVMTPLPDDAAEARSVLICVQDVTAQRALERQVVEQAERQIEAAEREMALFRNSPDELFVVRVEDAGDATRFVYEAFSPALETASGLRAADLVGRSPDQCLPPVLAQSILGVYRRCLAEQACIKFASTRQLPVGQRDVEGSVSPVRHPATGRIVRLVGAVRDVTERNRMEAALRQGQKMEAIGRLAAGVAHDFNNILQAVIGSLDLLTDQAADPQVRDIAGTALNAALRGSHLTHHLLSYARKQMLWPQAIDLAAFLPEVESLLSRTLGPHIDIALSVRRTPMAQADPGELQTALLNLAINAAHAMPKGGTLRIVAQEERAAGQSWVRITLADTGIGMDAATLAQAVEPFFTTSRSGGTGLGLSMVQGFAEQSGGTLHIASEPGRGTSVDLRLPAALSAPPAASLPVAQAGSLSGRILLVDDSTDVLVTVGAFLEKAGYAVTRAENGERALALLTRDRRFDILVSDYAMPGLNGLDLVARARLLLPGLPALIITGYAAIGEAEAEGTAVLHKPFQRHELLAALRRVMGLDAIAATRGDAGAE